MSVDGIKSFIREITNNKVNISKWTIYAWKEDISNKLNKSEYEKIKEELINSKKDNFINYTRSLIMSMYKCVY